MSKRLAIAILAFVVGGVFADWTRPEAAAKPHKTINLCTTSECMEYCQWRR